jgi:hypothetical protein
MKLLIRLTLIASTLSPPLVAAAGDDFDVEAYIIAVVLQPAVAQAEFDRLYEQTPAAAAYALARYAADECDLPKPSAMLEMYTGGLKQVGKKVVIVSNALTQLGYPDRTGLCRKAAEILVLAAQEAAECYSQPSSDFGIANCF